MDSNEEAYLLLLLADGNLPTGSFVASSGLESYVAHGFSTKPALQSTSDFIQDSLGTYARSSLPFVADAHRLVSRVTGDSLALDHGICQLKRLDELYEAMTLNHVARRASTSQGVALLTLYSKGFSIPVIHRHTDYAPPSADALVDRLKLMIRREDTPGHLPVCWGILTAALGLTLERAQHLHLFLHARSLLSASVRLNTIGPYAAQQLLLHTVKPLVAAELVRNAFFRTGVLDDPPSSAMDGPASTWPLGEILATRHDLQHSRIFNS